MGDNRTTYTVGFHGDISNLSAALQKGKGGMESFAASIVAANTRQAISFERAGDEAEKYVKELIDMVSSSKKVQKAIDEMVKTAGGAGNHQNVLAQLINQKSSLETTIRSEILRVQQASYKANMEQQKAQHQMAIATARNAQEMRAAFSAAFKDIEADQASLVEGMPSQLGRAFDQAVMKNSGNRLRAFEKDSDKIISNMQGKLASIEKQKATAGNKAGSADVVKSLDEQAAAITELLTRVNKLKTGVEGVRFDLGTEKAMTDLAEMQNELKGHAQSFYEVARTGDVKTAQGRGTNAAEAQIERDTLSLERYNKKLGDVVEGMNRKIIDLNQTLTRYDGKLTEGLVQDIDAEINKLFAARESVEKLIASNKATEHDVLSAQSELAKNATRAIGLTGGASINASINTQAKRAETQGIRAEGVSASAEDQITRNLSGSTAALEKYHERYQQLSDQEKQIFLDRNEEELQQLEHFTERRIALAREEAQITERFQAEIKAAAGESVATESANVKFRNDSKELIREARNLAAEEKTFYKKMAENIDDMFDINRIANRIEKLQTDIRKRALSIEKERNKIIDLSYGQQAEKVSELVAAANQAQAQHGAKAAEMQTHFITDASQGPLQSLYDAGNIQALAQVEHDLTEVYHQKGMALQDLKNGYVEATQEGAIPYSKQVEKAQGASRAFLRNLNDLSRFIMYDMLAAFGALSMAIQHPLSVLEKFEGKINEFSGTTFTDEMGATLAKLQGEKFSESALTTSLGSKFSATSLAGAGVEMSKLNQSSTQIINNLKDISNAAEATGEDINVVSETVIGLQNAADSQITKFNSSLQEQVKAGNMSAEQAQNNMKDTAYLADLLSAASIRSAADMKDLAVSFKYVGSLADSTEQPIEEVTAELAMLGNNMIVGSTAATALRQAFLRMANPTKEANEAMKALGVTTIDQSTGKMKTLRDVLGQLATSMKGTSDEMKSMALEAMFGDRAVSSLMALLNELQRNPVRFNSFMDSFDADKIRGLNAKMKEVSFRGLTKEMAEFKNTMESLNVEMGKGLVPSLTLLLDLIKSVANWFIGLSDSTKQAMGGAAALGAILTGLGAGTAAATFAVSSLVKVFVDGFINVRKFGSVLSDSANLMKFFTETTNKASTAITGAGVAAEVSGAQAAGGAVGWKALGMSMLAFGAFAAAILVWGHNLLEVFNYLNVVQKDHEDRTKDLIEIEAIRHQTTDNLTQKMREQTKVMEEQHSVMDRSFQDLFRLAHGMRVAADDTKGLIDAMRLLSESRGTMTDREGREKIDAAKEKLSKAGLGDVVEFSKEEINNLIEVMTKKMDALRSKSQKFYDSGKKTKEAQDSRGEFEKSFNEWMSFRRQLDSAETEMDKVRLHKELANQKIKMDAAILALKSTGQMSEEELAALQKDLEKFYLDALDGEGKVKTAIQGTNTERDKALKLQEKQLDLKEKLYDTKMAEMELEFLKAQNSEIERMLGTYEKIQNIQLPTMDHSSQNGVMEGKPKDVREAWLGKSSPIMEIRGVGNGHAGHDWQRKSDVGADYGGMVYSPFQAQVEQVQKFSYGTMVVLRDLAHKQNTYVLHHLAPAVADQLKPGTILEPGQGIGRLGGHKEILSQQHWKGVHLHVEKYIAGRLMDVKGDIYDIINKGASDELRKQLASETNVRGHQTLQQQAPDAHREAQNVMSQHEDTHLPGTTHQDELMQREADKRRLGSQLYGYVKEVALSRYKAASIKERIELTQAELKGAKGNAVKEEELKAQLESLNKDLVVAAQDETKAAAKLYESHEAAQIKRVQMEREFLERERTRVESQRIRDLEAKQQAAEITKAQFDDISTSRNLQLEQFDQETAKTKRDDAELTGKKLEDYMATRAKQRALIISKYAEAERELLKGEQDKTDALEIELAQMRARVMMQGVQQQVQVLKMESKARVTEIQKRIREEQEMMRGVTATDAVSKSILEGGALRVAHLTQMVAMEQIDLWRQVTDIVSNDNIDRINNQIDLIRGKSQMLSTQLDILAGKMSRTKMGKDITTLNSFLENDEQLPENLRPSNIAKMLDEDKLKRTPSQTKLDEANAKTVSSLQEQNKLHAEKIKKLDEEKTKAREAREELEKQLGRSSWLRMSQPTGETGLKSLYKQLTEDSKQELEIKGKIQAIDQQLLSLEGNRATISESMKKNSRTISFLQSEDYKNLQRSIRSFEDINSLTGKIVGHLDFMKRMPGGDALVGKASAFKNMIGDIGKNMSNLAIGGARALAGDMTGLLQAVPAVFNMANDVRQFMPDPVELQKKQAELWANALRADADYLTERNKLLFEKGDISRAIYNRDALKAAAASYAADMAKLDSDFMKDSRMEFVNNFKDPVFGFMKNLPELMHRAIDPMYSFQKAQEETAAMTEYQQKKSLLELQKDQKLRDQQAEIARADMNLSFAPQENSLSVRQILAEAFHDTRGGIQLGKEQAGLTLNKTMQEAGITLTQKGGASNSEAFSEYIQTTNKALAEFTKSIQSADEQLKAFNLETANMFAENLRQTLADNMDIGQFERQRQGLVIDRATESTQLQDQISREMDPQRKALLQDRLNGLDKKYANKRNDINWEEAKYVSSQAMDIAALNAKQTGGKTDDITVEFQNRKNATEQWYEEQKHTYGASAKLDEEYYAKLASDSREYSLAIAQDQISLNERDRQLKAAEASLTYDTLDDIKTAYENSTASINEQYSIDLVNAGTNQDEITRVTNEALQKRLAANKTYFDNINSYRQQQLQQEAEIANVKAQATMTPFDDIKSDREGQLKQLQFEAQLISKQYADNEETKNRLLKLNTAKRELIEYQSMQKLADATEQRYKQLGDLRQRQFDLQVREFKKQKDLNDEQIRSQQIALREIEAQIREKEKAKNEDIKAFNINDRIEFQAKLSQVDIDKELKDALEYISNPTLNKTSDAGAQTAMDAIKAKTDLMLSQAEMKRNLEQLSASGEAKYNDLAASGQYNPYELDLQRGQLVNQEYNATAEEAYLQRAKGAQYSLGLIDTEHQRILNQLKGEGKTETELMVVKKHQAEETQALNEMMSESYLKYQELHKQAIEDAFALEKAKLDESTKAHQDQVDALETDNLKLEKSIDQYQRSFDADMRLVNDALFEAQENTRQWGFRMTDVENDFLGLVGSIKGEYQSVQDTLKNPVTLDIQVAPALTSLQTVTNVINDLTAKMAALQNQTNNYQGTGSAGPVLKTGGVNVSMGAQGSYTPTMGSITIAAKPSAPSAPSGQSMAGTASDGKFYTVFSTLTNKYYETSSDMYAAEAAFKAARGFAKGKGFRQMPDNGAIGDNLLGFFQPKEIIAPYPEFRSMVGQMVQEVSQRGGTTTQLNNYEVNINGPVYGEIDFDKKIAQGIQASNMKQGYHNATYLSPNN